MTRNLSRRAIVAALLSGGAQMALAGAPLNSVRPQARSAPVSVAPDISPIPRIAPRQRETVEELIAAANLDGNVGVVVADARTGEVLERIEGDVELPPASVTKAVTALYALDVLGAEHRFITRILVDGEIQDGILRGNLILAGGGDPTLSADNLDALAQELQRAGLRDVTGRFLCWRGALPYAEEIEPSQLDYLGYNPAVSGLNLNYNRVHFEWKRVNGAWQTTMDARAETVVPRVTMADVRVADRSSPVFDTTRPDQWTVASGALGDGGSRWLPVRQPALYAGDVFRTLASDAGVRLPAPEVTDDLPTDTSELAWHTSAPLRTILNEMLLYSTNLTAEICGLAATRARYDTPLAITASAAQMNRWARARYGIDAGFRDHSGLSDENRISANAMVKLLVGEGADSPLRPILKRIAMLDAENRRIDDYPVVVRAKTGTLNFVSALSGYIETVAGEDLAFAIFTADLDRRERGIASGDEIPDGASAWNGRSKRLQQKLLQRWGLTYPDDDLDMDRG